MSVGSSNASRAKSSVVFVARPRAAFAPYAARLRSTRDASSRPVAHDDPSLDANASTASRGSAPAVPVPVPVPTRERETRRVPSDSFATIARKNDARTRVDDASSSSLSSSSSRSSRVVSSLDSFERRVSSSAFLDARVDVDLAVRRRGVFRYTRTVSARRSREITAMILSPRDIVSFPRLSLCHARRRVSRVPSRPVPSRSRPDPSRAADADDALGRQRARDAGDGSIRLDRLLGYFRERFSRLFPRSRVIVSIRARE